MKTWVYFSVFALSYHLVHSQDYFENPEELVKTLYDEVTFDPGQTPDWDKAKSMFLEEAVIVLRYSRDDMTVFNLQGWVDDFVTFIEDYSIEKTGFEERILDMKTFVYGDIASINVLFESHIPGTDRRNKGVDIFQMIKKEGKWLIVSIINERPGVAGPLPDVYDYE